jgi:hypothetical protein
LYHQLKATPDTAGLIKFDTRIDPDLKSAPKRDVIAPVSALAHIFSLLR